MNRKRSEQTRRYWPLYLAALLLIVGNVVLPTVAATRYTRGAAEASIPVKKAKAEKLDTALYDQKMLELANYASTTSSTTPRLWPLKGEYPKAGAILPFKRIVAYYGNFYSTRMGILGEFDPDVVLGKLKVEVAKWNAADPTTPVVPAIDYIAVTAQGSPGADGMYRMRMPAEHISKAIGMGRQVGGITILEVQAGLAPLQGEIEALEPYLKEQD
ncbi:MAG TPA: hypothetical protein VF696_02855, partial [Candidatus Paceibacterota bacterium]